MNLSGVLTRKRVITGSAVLGAALLIVGVFVLRRPERVAMERYVPADSLAFVEIDSLADLVDGMTGTKAWRELAPVLGLSSQLRQVGLVTDLIGRSGLGPDEAVVAGRAQIAIAITGIESDTGETEEGPFLHLRPNFALIVETHMKPEDAARLVRERASIIAQRIYGESVAAHSDDYRGSQLLIFDGPGSGHQLIASSAGSVILIANQAEAIKQCLDTIAGRRPTLADDAALKQRRPDLGRDPSVFAYVTEAGIQKLVDLWPLLIAGRSADPESISMFADLIEHLSKQAAAGLFYSSRFEDGGVTEEYLTMLRPAVAEALSQPLKSASAANFESLPLIPREIESLTLLSVDNAGDMPERVFRQLSPAVDIVAGVALREFLINLKKQYGLDPADSLGDAIGSEIAVVTFGEDQPRAMFFRVNDKARVATMADRYVRRKGSSIKTEQHNGTEILVSADDDRRAVAFVREFLVLGARDQIARVIDTNATGDGIEGDERLKQLLRARPANSSVVHYGARVEDAGKLLLAVSKLTRVTDGSLELLDRDAARKALDRVPRSISFTEFRDYGVYTQTHSAVGNFSLIGSLLGKGDE